MLGADRIRTKPTDGIRTARRPRVPVQSPRGPLPPFLAPLSDHLLAFALSALQFKFVVQLRLLRPFRIFRLFKRITSLKR